MPSIRPAAINAARYGQKRHGAGKLRPDHRSKTRGVEILQEGIVEHHRGMQHAADGSQAVAYLRRTRGSRGRPSTGWESLTPTELEVVRLVVAGLNNPEIGSRLFMSRGTVKTHLAHVFTKLGVGNRTELATFAAGRLGVGS